MVSSFISALGGIDMALDGFDFDGFQFESPPPPWSSYFKYMNHRDPNIDAADAFERFARAMFTDVTCLECEHFRQDSDDGTICPRCTKGQSVIISDGKKKKHCMHYDKLTT